MSQLNKWNAIARVKSELEIKTSEDGNYKYAVFTAAFRKDTWLNGNRSYSEISANLAVFNEQEYKKHIGNLKTGMIILIQGHVNAKTSQNDNTFLKPIIDKIEVIGESLPDFSEVTVSGRVASDAVLEPSKYSETPIASFDFAVETYDMETKTYSHRSYPVRYSKKNAQSFSQYIKRNNFFMVEGSYKPAQSQKYEGMTFWEFKLQDMFMQNRSLEKASDYKELSDEEVDELIPPRPIETKENEKYKEELKETLKETLTNIKNAAKENIRRETGIGADDDDEIEEEKNRLLY
jgi:hypothetical protein